MRSALALVFLAVVTLLLSAPASQAFPERGDLTGKWACDDGGTYWVRQVGDDVWWTGRSNEKGKVKAFANVFHGTIRGNKIVGSWADDPAGEARGAGTITLEIVGEGKRLELKKLQETGGFSGAIWTPAR